MPRRRDDFPPDRGLELRMVVAVLAQVVLVAAYVGALVWIATSWEAGVGWLLYVGLFVMFATAVTAMYSVDAGQPAERERVALITERIAAVADVVPPSTRVHPNDAPLSWTTAVPFGTRRIHVTTGLLAQLDDRDLEAVIAHEVGHLVNRDAVVMTALVGPPVRLLEAYRGIWRDFSGWVLLFFGGWLVLPFAAIGTLGGRILSRHRELAADRAAAILTGSPARLQAALLAVGGGLERIPDRDLRTVVARDVFHFVPVRPARGVARLWATHPPIDDRVERLARMEERLHA